MLRRVTAMAASDFRLRDRAGFLDRSFRPATSCLAAHPPRGRSRHGVTAVAGVLEIIREDIDERSNDVQGRLERVVRESVALHLSFVSDHEVQGAEK